MGLETRLAVVQLAGGAAAAGRLIYRLHIIHAALGGGMAYGMQRERTVAVVGTTVTPTASMHI
jgi:hypothetical protein